MDTYSSRRKSLSQRAAHSDYVYVLTAHTSVQSTADAAFQFQQEANFFYLTGIDVADWQLIIARGTSWLVSPDVDDVHQVFDGSLSSDEAKRISGVEEVISRPQASELLTDLAKECDIVYTLGDDPHAEYYDFVCNPAPIDLKRQLEGVFRQVKDCRPLLTAMRAIKQADELTIMQRAIDLTVDAFEVVKQKLPELSHEYEVEAEFSYHFRRHGAQGHAYDPIVAGGHNACTLHYGANNDSLHPSELLVLDIGARVDGYAADITRTYAVGEPTARQRAVHAAVQGAHGKIINLLGPGVSVRQYHDDVDVIMKQALISLDLMTDLDDEKSYRTYFPHAISHGLGIDVHDSLGDPKVFASGMVLTVEPGIYIPEESIGVRIEDDILITKDGHRNLSSHLSTDL